MSDQRFIIEMGMGNDQYGQDYTKAAGRAIEDAFRHSAIPMFQALEPALGLTPQEMRVQVTIGVQDPAQVDTEALVSNPAARPGGGARSFWRAKCDQSRYRQCHRHCQRSD